MFRLHQVPQGTHVRIRVAGAGVEQEQRAAQVREVAALEEALDASEKRDKESQNRIADLGQRLNVALAMGEMGSMLLDSQRVMPRRALEQGCVFRHPGLDGALSSLV